MGKTSLYRRIYEGINPLFLCSNIVLCNFAQKYNFAQLQAQQWAFLLCSDQKQRVRIRFKPFIS